MYFNDTLFDYINCDYNIIRSLLAIINLHRLFHNLQFNGVINMLYDIIFKTIDSHCRKKTFFNNKYPIWFSSKIIDVIYMKKIAHMLKKLLQNVTTIDFLNCMQNVNLNRNSIGYNNYIFNIQISIKTNHELFYHENHVYPFQTGYCGWFCSLFFQCL